MALGLFTNYAEIGERAFTKWRALAADFFIQDSWKPSEKLKIEGGVRYAFWPPWYSRRTTSPTSTRGSTTRTTRRSSIRRPGESSRARATTASCCRARIRGRRQRTWWSQATRGCWRSSAASRGLLARPTTTCSSRGWDCRTNSTTRRSCARSGGVFHNRVTLNDSTLLGGNPPFQPMVTVSNGSVDNPGGAAGATDLPFGMQGQDVEFKLPMSYMWSAGIQREIPFGIVLDLTYVGRRGRYQQRERNINQLLPGTLQANPGVNIAALRPYKGYGALRVSENSGTFEVQQLPGQRRTPVRQRLEGERGVHLRQVDGQRQRQTQRHLEHLRRRQLLGAVELRPPARACRVVHLRPAALA